MNTGRFFWGTFLVGAGVLLLLQRFGVVTLSVHMLWKTWPLVLVFWGAAILARGSRFAPLSSSLAGLTLAAVMTAFVYSGPEYVLGEPEGSGSLQNFTQTFEEGLRRASFRFDSGSGSFNVEGTTPELCSASVRTQFGHYVMRSERVEAAEDVSLTLEGEKKAWTFSRSANHVDLRFNSTVMWDMHFAVGASRVDLDLSSLKVERVTLEAGASQVRIRLGDLSDETRLTVSSGVSMVRILVPYSSACEINAMSPLSRKSFKDFVRSEEGTYRTENIATAERKIFITLESGLSQLTVIRY